MSEKKAFERRVDEWMKKFTGLIDGLEMKIQDETENLDDTAKEELREKINDLKSVRTMISDKHLDLRKANDADWPEIRDRVEKLMGQIDKEFKESLAFFH